MKITGRLIENEDVYVDKQLICFSYRLFGGLKNDIKRKAPWYLSDFKDALALQSVASIFFLYFACLTPIITFGGLLGEATGNNIVRIVINYYLFKTILI